MGATLLLASKALFAAAGCGAGLVLARTARRERGLPVHAWASAAVFVGGLGLIGFAVGPALEARSGAFAAGVMIASDLLQRVALAGLALFLWRVFGAAEGEACWLRGAVLAAVLGALAVDAAATLFLQEWPRALPVAAAAASQLVFAMPFLWASLESGRAWRAGRRRLALGLAEPEVVNRFGLFALGCGAFVAVNLSTAAAKLPAAAGMLPALDGLRALLYAALSVFVVLAIYPPAAYRRRLAAAHPAS